jgi:phage shock protein A
MIVDFNFHRGQLMPQIKQILDVRTRHEAEIEKVNRLAKEAEEQLATLDAEVHALSQTIAELDAKIDALDSPKAEP